MGGDMWHFRHPLDFIGSDGGGGIGAGPGITVGGAIALKGTARLPVAILGDGDYLMGVNALWTAATGGVPLLAVVCNNRSFFNDEVHQERVAKERGRPVENRWIGQRIDDPAPDLAMLARAQGLDGIGPVTTRRRVAGRRWSMRWRRLQEGKARRRRRARRAGLQPGDGRGHHARASTARLRRSRRWPYAVCRTARRLAPRDDVLPRISISTTAARGTRRTSGRYVETIDPAQRRAIARVAHADAEDADAAIVAAHDAFGAGAALKPLRARATCCARPRRRSCASTRKSSRCSMR